MRLLLTKGWKGEEREFSKTPNKQLISELIESLDWNDFNSIRLEKNYDNWIDVSGNTSSDGLSIVYVDEGVIHVSDDAPDSTTVLKSALISYFAGDNKFKSLGFCSETNSNESANTNFDYNHWKKEYEEKQVIEKKKNKISILVGLFITGLICLFFYLWITNELLYIGRETSYTNAQIVEFSYRPAFRTLHKFAKYEFTYQNKKYHGYFDASRTYVYENIGDELKVKFVVNNPSISKREASYSSPYWRKSSDL